jgi:hypothetical protein
MIFVPDFEAGLSIVEKYGFASDAPMRCGGIASGASEHPLLPLQRRFDIGRQFRLFPQGCARVRFPRPVGDTTVGCDKVTLAECPSPLTGNTDKRKRFRTIAAGRKVIKVGPGLPRLGLAVALRPGG